MPCDLLSCFGVSNIKIAAALLNLRQIKAKYKLKYSKYSGKFDCFRLLAPAADHGELLLLQSQTVAGFIKITGYFDE
jgi:hypothetical protein